MGDGQSTNLPYPLLGGSRVTVTQTAGIVLFRDARALGVNGFDVLMVEQYGDTWSFPKGHRENGETLLECATRELSEETGISHAEGLCYYFTGEPFTYRRESIAGKKELKEITLYTAELTPLSIAFTQRPESKDKAITKSEWVNVESVCDRLDAEEDRKAFWKIYGKSLSKKV